MVEAQETRYPKYVTDGSHIYIWHEEFIPLFEQGKLKPSSPPELKKVKKMSAREQTKLDEARKHALADAERAVAVLSVPVKQPVASDKFEELFGKDE